MITIDEVVALIETKYPLSWQESYDNCGLQTGNLQATLTGIVISLDCTEQVIDEALANGANLIISHHPVIFSGLKKITGKSDAEKVIIKAIKHDISLYALHTNFDNAPEGVSYQLANILGLNRIKPLQVSQGQLNKLSTYVPVDHADSLRNALFDAGAGGIGNYDSCSFNVAGIGTFRPNQKANPFLGSAGELHQENEIKLEVLVPNHLLGSVTKALFNQHPYEEVAYEIIQLKNEWKELGSGAWGEFDEPKSADQFLNLVKETFGGNIKFTSKVKQVKRVGICGGTGIFLLKNAFAAQCDAFITSDVKYHQFFDSSKNLMIVDIGHYEAEILALSTIRDFLLQNFSTFAIQLAESHTNPVNYL